MCNKPAANVLYECVISYQLEVLVLFLGNIDFKPPTGKKYLYSKIYQGVFIVIVQSHIWIRHREMFWHPKIEICSQFSKIIQMSLNNTSMQKNIYSVMVAVVAKCLI